MGENVPPCLQVTQDDISKLLAAGSHLGTQACEVKMQQYVWKQRADGVHIINIFKTWEKIVFAARILAAIENPADIVVISSRLYGQRAALKFQQYAGTQAVVGRFTPGTFTNYITKTFKEPRVIVVVDARADQQAVHEASYSNIPVIALCNTDSKMRCVDVAIPCNNAGKNSVGLVMWMLAREVLRIKGSIIRDQPWAVMVDMFFYRDPEEAEKEAQEVAAQQAAERAPLAPTDRIGEPPQLLEADAGVPAANWESTDWSATPGEGAAADAGWGAAQAQTVTTAKDEDWGANQAWDA